MVVGEQVDRTWIDVRREDDRSGVSPASPWGLAAVVGRVGELRFAAASARVVGLALVEGDRQQPPGLVGRRGEDPRHPGSQEGIDRGQAPRPAVHARRVMAVVAQVGHDERVARR